LRAGAGVSEDKEKMMGTDERGEGGRDNLPTPKLHADCTAVVRPCHTKARDHVCVAWTNAIWKVYSKAAVMFSWQD